MRIWRPLSALPGEVNHLAEKDSRQINMLEQILIAKVFNFGGICSSLWTVRMPEIALGCHAIADKLLQQLDVRKAAIALPVPDQLIIAGDLENPAGTRNESDLTKLGGER